MADEGYISGLLSGVQDARLRSILEDCFRHLLREQRFGEPTNRSKATNFGAYYQGSTTGASTSEFSFLHGIAGVSPRLAIPCLDLNRPGSRLVDLEVSRAADSKRLYLKAAAGSTSAPFILLVE